MFDLRKNPFYLLRVSPETTAAEILDARHDADADGVASQHELQMAGSDLSKPLKRLACEMSSLWGVPHTSAPALLARVSGEEDFDLDNENLPPLARANLAAHLCASDMLSADNRRRQVIEWLIGAREGIIESVLQGEFNAARKKAGIPPVQEEHLHAAARELRQAHLDAALNAVEKAAHPGKLMTGIVEEWRYAKTPGGMFVRNMVGGYDRWCVSALRPNEERIRKAAEKLRQNPNNSDALAAIDNELAEWDEYSQSSQLMHEAKMVDHPQSLVLYHELREIAVAIANKNKEPEVSLKIAEMLLRTFLELPTALKQLPEDIETLKQETKILPLLPLVKLTSEILENLGRYAEDACGRKGAHRRFFTVASTILQSPEFARMDMVWKLLNDVGFALHKNGHEQAARNVMEDALHLAEKHGAPSHVRKIFKDGVSVLRNNLAQKSSGGIPWWVWLIGAIILYGIFQ